MKVPERNPSERVEAMYDLYARSQITLDQVGEAFGISGGHVGALFREAGLMVPPPGRRRVYQYKDQARRDARIDAMREMYEGGATLDEVGEAFGCAGENVLQLFQRAGVP